MVDDGSKDNTSDVVLRFSDNDSRITYIHQENQGVSAARNYGISHSHGKYIVPLDADDLIETEFLKCCVDEIESNENLKIVYTDVTLFEGINGEFHLPEFSMEQMIAANCICNTAMYRRADYDMTCGYNSNMREGNEDWDFWLSLLELGTEVKKISKPLVWYRVRKESRSTSAAKNLGILRRKLWENHKELYSHYYFDPKKSNEYVSLQNELTNILNSRQWRYGHYALHPSAWLKHIVQKIFH